MMDPNFADVSQSLFSWSTLSTVGGAAAFVLMITQFFRSGIKKLVKVPMHFFMLVVSFLTLLGAHILGPGESVRLADIPMLIGNSFVVATSAYGTYHTTNVIVNNGASQNNPPSVDSGNG